MIFLSCFQGHGFAESITLKWDANTELDLKTYYIYYGEVPRSEGPYTQKINVGNVTAYTVDDLAPDKAYYFAVTAEDNSQNESGFSVEYERLPSAVSTPIPPGDVFPVGVSNINTASGKSYVVVENLSNGTSFSYIDRSYKYREIPDFLLGSVHIKTANGDARNSDDPFVTFDVDRSVTVYLAHDDRVAVPAWMSDYSDTGYDLITADLPMSVFSKDFSKGSVVLGPNNASSNMYTVMIVGREVADTEPPTISIKLPTDGDLYESAEAFLEISGTATDNVGVKQVRWQITGGAVGVATGTESWKITDLLLSDGENTVTIIAMDDDGNESTDILKVIYGAAPVTGPIAVPVTISNLTVASGQAYQIVAGLTNNTSLAYIDRNYKYRDVPEFLQNAVHIMTANRDIRKTSDPFITFDVDVDVTVYIAHDDRVAVPAWMSWYQDTGLDLVTADVPMSIYSMDFEAGSVVLGPNNAYSNMYTVIIVGRKMVDTEPPILSIDSPGAGGFYESDNPTVEISGTAFDDVGVKEVWWSSTGGGSGVASGIDTWRITNLSLIEGSNMVTVTASDDAGNESTATLDVTYQPPDTVPPSITITSPTTQILYSTDSPTITITGQASDAGSGLSVVAWANASGDSGIAEGTTSWMVPDIRLSEGDNSIVVVALDEAGNENSAGILVTYTPEALSITNLTVASGAAYQVMMSLSDGTHSYIDRSYKYRQVPEFLEGSVYIMTGNRDIKKTNDPFITFDVNKDATVYIAHDDRVPVPAWMFDYVDTGSDLITADVPMSIYSMSVTEGKVILGPNAAFSNMYTVIIK
jgi:hypothetical protein